MSPNRFRKVTACRILLINSKGGWEREKFNDFHCQAKCYNVNNMSPSGLKMSSVEGYNLICDAKNLALFRSS